MVKINLQESVESRPMLLHEVLEQSNGEISFLWEGFIPRPSLSGIVAESGIGKSTFALELCIAVCSGKDEFLGYPLNTRTKQALFISTEENLINMGARLKNFSSIVKLQEVIKKIGLHIKQGVGLDIVKSLEESIPEGGLDIIVIDALGDIIKEDSNSMVIVRELLSKLQAVADQLNCVVFFVHHVRKSTQSSITKMDTLGSTAIDNKVRALLGLQKTIKTGEVMLRLLKSNYSDPSLMDSAILLKNSINGLEALNILSADEQYVNPRFEALSIVKSILQEFRQKKRQKLLMKYFK